MKKILLFLFLALGVLSFAAPSYVDLNKIQRDGSEPPTTDTLRVLESQGSWVVVASVSQLNLPSYPP